MPTLFLIFILSRCPQKIHLQIVFQPAGRFFKTGNSLRFHHNRAITLLCKIQILKYIQFAGAQRLMILRTVAHIMQVHMVQLI